MFLDLYNKGLLTEEVSEQYYDDEAQVFLADRYIVGTCPRCGHPNAYGDQCEKCGSTLSPRELINPRSTLTGKPPVLRETKHWYLPMQNYEGWLKEWILKDHADDWKTNVYGQCKSWIDAGLQPRAMTRERKPLGSAVHWFQRSLRLPAVQSVKTTVVHLSKLQVTLARPR